MENSQPPDFKFDLKTKKKLENSQWFEIKDLTTPPTYDDYILLKRQIEQEPNIGYIVRLFGCRLAKTEKGLLDT